MSASVSGCAGSSQDSQPQRAEPVAESSPLNEELRRACAGLAETERMPVLCPTWLPATDRGPTRYKGFSVSQRDFERGECQYLIQMSYDGPEAGPTVPFHILFGGRCERFPLKTAQGHWPDGGSRVRYLRLLTRVAEPGSPAEIVRPRVVTRVTVRRRAALVLQVAPYPRGGIHGGHYAIVWNRRDAGYVLSLHYRRGDAGSGGTDAPLPPRQSDIRALVRAAGSMTLVRGQ